MNTVDDVLRRNLGQTLTPELITGILVAVGPPELEAAIPPRPIPASPVSGYAPSSRTLVLDDHARVADWVAQRVGCSVHTWAGYVGIGLEQNGDLIAGVVIEGYNGVNAYIHVAGVGRQWLNRAMLFTVFDYAFHQLGLRRLTGIVAADNVDALRFDQHLGFEVEAVMRDAVPSGDAYILVMRPETCRYLRRSHGQ